MPKNTPMGIYLSAFIFVIGFAMVWHIFWLAIVAFIASLAVTIIRTFDEHSEYVLPAKEVAKIESEQAKRKV